MRRLFWLFLVLFLGGCATAAHRAGNTKITKMMTSESRPRPSVILIHGCGGTSPHEHWMNILDENGFNAVLIDYINLRGYSSICDLNAPISIDKASDDINHIIGWVQSQKWHKGAVSAMGFSFGGGIANSFTDINNLKVKGVAVNHISQLHRIISVYPLCAIGGLAEKTTIPAQIHFGLNDYWTPHSVCMTDRLDKSNYELIFYENAMHGFDIPNTPTHVNGTMRLQFNPAAFQQMKMNVIRFLQ